MANKFPIVGIVGKLRVTNFILHLMQKVIRRLKVYFFSLYGTCDVWGMESGFEKLVG